MPVLSAFTPCGMLAMSAQPSHAEAIYEAMRANLSPEQGFATDFDSPQQARLYAQAMVFGAAQYALERAANQAIPRKAIESIRSSEKDARIVPPAGATLRERQLAIETRRLATRGARRENVEAALSAALGSDFVAYRTTPDAERVTVPGLPGTVGNFVLATPPKVVSFDVGVSVLGSAVTVPYTQLLGEAIQVGDYLAVDVHPSQTRTERIHVTATGSGTLTAEFVHPHDVGTEATSGHAPVWTSNQRHALIVLTAGAARDPERRRIVDETMARLACAVSVWQVTDGDGPFAFGVSEFGVTSFGAL